MAWRIHHYVQRGELDNREPGKVRGRLWIDGLAEPVVLELAGNACPDLAGCFLTFENQAKTIPLDEGTFALHQQGSIGDLTASRKVRVPDVPVTEFLRLRKAGLPVPEHLANGLFLEWYSEANGRVVLEGTDYKLTISPPAWTLSQEQEQERQRDAAQGFSGFLAQLNQAVDAAKADPPEGKPWDEFDYEKFLRESDVRTDKYMELLDKYENHPDRDRLVAREMGWEPDDDDFEDDPADGAIAQQDPGFPMEPFDGGSDNPTDDASFCPGDFDADEINRICAEAAASPLVPDPATEGVDWVRTGDGDIRHPLSLRAFDASTKLHRKCDELGLDSNRDKDLLNFITEFQITGAKLAGALNSLAYGRELRESALVVAYLKRALGHLHAAQAALESLSPKGLLPPEIIKFARNELFAIREETLRLMNQFREMS